MNLSAHLIPIEAVIAPGHLFTYYSRQSLFVMWPPLPATIGEERREKERSRKKHEMDVADKEVWLRYKTR